MRWIELIASILPFGEFCDIQMLVWEHAKFWYFQKFSKYRRIGIFWPPIALKKKIGRPEHVHADAWEWGTFAKGGTGLHGEFSILRGVFEIDYFSSSADFFFRISWIFKIIGHFWKNSFHAQNSSFSWICRKNKVYKGNPWRFWNKSAILYQIT